MTSEQLVQQTLAMLASSEGGVRLHKPVLLAASGTSSSTARSAPSSGASGSTECRYSSSTLSTPSSASEVATCSCTPS